jgi:hypothetical protein
MPSVIQADTYNLGWPCDAGTEADILLHVRTTVSVFLEPELEAPRALGAEKLLAPILPEGTDVEALTFRAEDSRSFPAGFAKPNQPHRRIS